MRNEQICKTTNIFWRSASLYTLLAIRIRIGIKITLFSLNWKGAFKASNETYGNWEHKSSSTNFQVKIMKKRYLVLQTFQQLCSMASIYLDKICVHFLDQSFFLKYHKILFSSLKLPVICTKILFLKKVVFLLCLVVTLIF